MIKDSGNRTEFATGAVRDIQEGKGRCDLMPLKIVSEIVGSPGNPDVVLHRIGMFVDSGDLDWLYTAVDHFIRLHFDDEYEAMLELSKHFEEGAAKYGEHNWQKGIPVKRYIDSAVRHYLRFLHGEEDERHDRAFCWNIMCAIWTCYNKPELNEYIKEAQV